MRCTKSHTFFLDKDSGYIVTRLYQFLNMLETTSVWKWFLWCNISLWWWTHQNTQVYYFSLQSIFDNIIVWPAYTSLGHGQNFVQKDWVNGLSSHAPDEERIGSTIIMFCYKNKCSSTEEETRIKCGFRRRCAHCHDCNKDFRGGECLGKHVVLFMKGSLLQWDVCGK